MQQEIHFQRLIQMLWLNFNHPLFSQRPRTSHSIEIDANEAYCIHFVLYDDKDSAAVKPYAYPIKI